MPSNPPDEITRRRMAPLEEAAAKVMRGMQPFMNTGALEEFFSTPAAKNALREYRVVVDQFVSNQEYVGRWGFLTISRKANVADIGWGFYNLPHERARYTVAVSVAEVALDSPDSLYPIPIHADNASSQTTRISAQLLEGSTYYVELIIRDSQGELSQPGFDIICAAVSVPLSKKNKDIFKAALAAAENSDQQMSDDIDSYIKKRDAFDKKLADGISQIKAKGLSPEDERERIEEFEDYLRSRKESFGL